MEAFLTTHAAYTVRRQWSSVRKSLRDDESADVKHHVDSIVQGARTSFHFYVLAALASRGTAANRQLFYLSLVMRHKGLSRSGLQLLSGMNLGLPPRSFDPELVAHEQECALERRYLLVHVVWLHLVFSFSVISRTIMESKIVVMWVDNFSKCHAVALQGIASGAFRDCNWTGQAIKVYQGPDVSVDIDSFPAMPDHIFDTGTASIVRRRIRTLCKQKWKYLQQSWVERFKVNTVPVKPVVDPLAFPNLHRILNESRDGLRNFHPMAIMPQNIGSNRGLMLILKHISDSRSNASGFQFLCADCNIFMRIMKVMSDHV